jgi:hypothetical protein
MTPTSPCSSPSIKTTTTTRRRTTIRFDLSSTATTDDGPAICLSEQECQAMWWSRSETNQMKQSNAQKPFFSDSCVGDVFKSIWQFQGCSPAFTFFKNIRFIYDRSSLDDTDFSVIYYTLLSRDNTNKQDLLILNDELPRKRHNVKRVLHVQKFLHSRMEHADKKAELLRITSTYHSAEFTKMARLVGEADAVAASCIPKTSNNRLLVKEVLL